MRAVRRARPVAAGTGHAGTLAKGFFPTCLPLLRVQALLNLLRIFPDIAGSDGLPGVETRLGGSEEGGGLRGYLHSLLLVGPELEAEERHHDREI